MSDIFQRLWENLIGRISGPMKFRLILQPLVAIFFAVRAGIHDAREGRPPFLWTALTDKSQRRSLLHSAWGHIGKVFIVACIIDAIYQLLEHRGVYILEMFIVATVLAVLPYIIIRGPVSRVVKLLYHPRKQNAQGEQHVK